MAQEKPHSWAGPRFRSTTGSVYSPGSRLEPFPWPWHNKLHAERMSSTPCLCLSPRDTTGKLPARLNGIYSSCTHVPADYPIICMQLQVITEMTIKHWLPVIRCFYE